MSPKFVGVRPETQAKPKPTAIVSTRVGGFFYGPTSVEFSQARRCGRRRRGVLQGHQRRLERRRRRLCERFEEEKW
ncbi:hypothetical protein MRX96_013156 [Rhipicephalus microplus]